VPHERAVVRGAAGSGGLSVMGFELDVSGGRSPSIEREGAHGLGDEIKEFFGAAVECLGSGAYCIDEDSWYLSYWIDGTEEEWLPRLIDFLRAWGVPRDARLGVLTDEEHKRDADYRFFDVYPQTERSLTRDEFLADPLGHVWAEGVAPEWV